MDIKLARPEADVVRFIGDGSYMMANSKLATAVMRRALFTIVLTDHHGCGCINRLQSACGGAGFDNLYASANVEAQPGTDFVAHAASMDAHAEKALDIADLEAKIQADRVRAVPSVIVIDTAPFPGTGPRGYWWDVAVPDVSERHEVRNAKKAFKKQTTRQRAD